MDSNSSSSSAYSDSAYSEMQLPCNYYYHQKEETSTKQLPTVHSASKYSVRKIPAKNKIMKKPIAPFPRTPPKVYKVDPVNFRDVVQKLTGAPELQPRRLHVAAPRPFSLSLPGEWFPLGTSQTLVNMPSSAQEEQPQSVKTINFGELMSPLELSVSPPSLACSSCILLSP